MFRAMVRVRVRVSDRVSDRVKAGVLCALLNPSRPKYPISLNPDPMRLCP